MMKKLFSHSRGNKTQYLYLPIVYIKVLLFTLVSIPAALFAITIPATERVQFNQAGHLIAFESGGVFVASADHLLKVSFQGANKVSPRANPRTAKEVTYSSLWDGIDLQYTAAKNGIMESTWHLAPTADVADIRLSYNAPLNITVDGSLQIQYKNGWMRNSAPIAWQNIRGKRTPIEVNFKLRPTTNNQVPLVGFELGTYASQYSVMIDPVLNWNTSIGANGANADDNPSAIALDSSGNIYITGESESSWGSPIVAHQGGLYNIFVAKLDASGTLLWNTFLGGSSGADYGEGIALDASGNIYITGYGYNGNWGAPLANGGGGLDILVAKLNNDGVRQWHTFYGGSNGDIPASIAVAGTSVYVTGNTYLNSWGTPIVAHSGKQDIFILKLDNAGTYQWNTFAGSSEHDIGMDIALDAAENVYIIGHSTKNWGSPVNAHSLAAYNQRDIVAAKFNASGALQWNTFHGTAENDVGSAIAVKSDGSKIYLAGINSKSSALPEPDWMADALNSHSGGEDAFVAELDASGALQWHTFMGSTSGDGANGVALDVDGNVYIGGYTRGSWGSPLSPHNGNQDVFVESFDSNGGYLWHTYSGTPYSDLSMDIAVDSLKNIYVTGNTRSPLPNSDSDSNGFVMRFGEPIEEKCQFFIIPVNNKLTALCL